MSGGYYCSKCGAMYSSPGWGTITCGQCGGLGLRGYNGKRPKRITCPRPDCDWTGWDDRCNDDLGRHVRRHEREWGGI